MEQENAFVAWLLDGQPEPPKYFAQMKKINKLGPPLINTLPTPANFDRHTLERSDLEPAWRGRVTVKPPASARTR